MQTWKVLMQMGEDATQEFNYLAAERHYIQARECAEKLFVNSEVTSLTVTAVLVSYHNLANCLKCQGRYEIVLAVLQKMHRLLDERLHDSEIDSEQRVMLLRGRRQARRQLMAFSKLMNLSYQEILFGGEYQPDKQPVKKNFSYH